MMDVLMAGTLLLCFFLMKLFTDWCDSQVSGGRTDQK